MIEYALKFIVAGAVVTLASYVAKKGDPIITSLLLMMPAGSLVGFYFVGLSATRETFSRSVGHTVLTLPLYILAFLLPLLALTRFTGLAPWAAVSISFIVWLAGALCYYRMSLTL